MALWELQPATDKYPPDRHLQKQRSTGELRHQPDRSRRQLQPDRQTHESASREVCRIARPGQPQRSPAEHPERRNQHEQPRPFPWATHNDAFEDRYSAAFDWVPSPRTYVSISAGHLKYGRHEVGTFSDRLSHGFAGSNFQFSDLSPDLQQVNGFVDAAFSSRLVRDDFSRSHLNADVTRYATWHGGHTLKAGLQFERMSNDVLLGAQKPAVILFWDASYFTTDGRAMRGKYGHYLVTRPYTEGDVRASNTGLFIQDAWTVTPRLTLNLGVRAENEHVPSYRPENPGIHFGFGDKIAPRVGFAFDVRGDSRWKLYGSWGSSTI